MGTHITPTSIKKITSLISYMIRKSGKKKQSFRRKKIILSLEINLRVKQ